MLEKDSFYSIIHGKAIEDRIEGLAIFSSYERRLIDCVQREIDYFSKYGDTATKVQHFDVTICRERITISWLDYRNDPTAVHIDFKQHNMAYVERLSQVNAIYNVLVSRTYSSIHKHIHNCSFSLSEIALKNTVCDYKAFRVSVQMENQRYTPPTNW